MIMAEDTDKQAGRFLTVEGSDFSSQEEWYNFLYKAAPDLDPDCLVNDRITLTVIGVRYLEEQVVDVIQKKNYVLDELKESLQDTLDQQEHNALELAATRALMDKANKKREAIEDAKEAKQLFNEIAYDGE
jgi:hypothetical protein